MIFLDIALQISCSMVRTRIFVKQKVTQPAVFLHSVISALCMGDDFKPEMTAGHSLGEFSALVAAEL